MLGCGMLRHLREMYQKAKISAAVLLDHADSQRFPDRLTRPSVMYKPPPLPKGVPTGYDTHEVDGKHVVTIGGVATSAPRWETREESRRDAWERFWADERGATALATDRVK